MGWRMIAGKSLLAKYKTLEDLTKLTGKRIIAVLIKRGIAQSGSAPALGAGCREFESLYPDQIFEV